MAYEKLSDILTNKFLATAIKKSSSVGQTSCLEGYHSVINQFAPKMLAYSYHGMLCRYVKNCTLSVTHDLTTCQLCTLFLQHQWSYFHNDCYLCVTKCIITYNIAQDDRKIIVSHNLPSPIRVPVVLPVFHLLFPP